MLQSRFVTRFFSYTILSISLISSILLLTDKEVFSHANGQELNSTNNSTVSINELISKLENNITKLEEQYTDLQNLNENLTRRLGTLEQSLIQDISVLHQRIDELLGYANCIADATENNFRISEQCPSLQ
jgi:predicted  nucleic acid-binding Zn-ribbon protein